MEKNTILIYSGGMDSTVLLYQLIKQGHVVRALSFDYGQRHAKELQAADDICKLLSVEHRTIDLRCVTPLLGGSSQTDPSVEVPEGHYEEENMKLTVVPNRNMMMLSIATAWAVSTKSNAVAYAAHAGDHAIYPDCRQEFVDVMNTAMLMCDWHGVTLHAPFTKLDKGDIARFGIELGVPFEKTWTCYKGLELPCGKCGSCQERLEAFHNNGVPDPLTYAHEAA